jgi:hypothetical protein
MMELASLHSKSFKEKKTTDSFNVDHCCKDGRLIMLREPKSINHMLVEEYYSVSISLWLSWAARDDAGTRY